MIVKHALDDNGNDKDFGSQRMNMNKSIALALFSTLSLGCSTLADGPDLGSGSSEGSESGGLEDEDSGSESSSGGESDSGSDSTGDVEFDLIDVQVIARFYRENCSQVPTVSVLTDDGVQLTRTTSTPMGCEQDGSWPNVSVTTAWAFDVDTADGLRFEVTECGPLCSTVDEFLPQADLQMLYGGWTEIASNRYQPEDGEPRIQDVHVFARVSPNQ